MKPPPIPAGEPERLAELHRSGLLDTVPEQVYDDLARLAAHICQTPMALVSLIDADRQWIKASVGAGEGMDNDRAFSFCAHAIAGSGPLIVPDATLDERFADNPLVVGAPGIRFYAGAPLVSRDGHALGTLCVIDRAPRQLSPEQVDMLRALGRQVMSQMELRLRLAEQVELAKNALVSVVSHELRTPLTSIRGSLGLIEGGALGEVPPRMVRLVEIARVNTERLIRLINDILDLEKIEGGKLELRRRPLDAEELVEAAVSGTREMTESARVALTWRTDPAWAARRRPLLGDRDRLLQVLANLLSNAVKVSPPEGLVEIVITAAGGERVRIAVRDQGPGIPAAELHRIFGKFQQIDSSDSRSRGGTGLGLAISKAIIDEHQGEIGLETEELKGSTFWFEIPLAPDDTPDETPDQRAAAADGGAGFQDVWSLVLQSANLGLSRALPQGMPRRAGCGEPRVLLVDANADSRQVLAEMLRSEGLALLEAANGPTALETAQRLPPDLVILDVELPGPGMGGHALVEELRRGPLSGTPLLVYTVQDLSAEERRRLRLGPTRHLTKARASERELLETVLGLLAAAGEPDA
jgi:signal transduction histidine kinase